MKIEIKGTGCKKELLEMLAWIELLGNVGHSASFKVYADGDGGSRWKFEFEDEEQQIQHKKLRQKLCNEYINTQKDIEYFEI